jgi:hypothetical protein
MAIELIEISRHISLISRHQLNMARHIWLMSSHELIMST